MTKFFENLVEIICWATIVFIVVLVFGFFGYIIKSQLHSLTGTISFAALSILGLIIGLFAAERVRKKIECSTIFFRIFSSSDVD